MLDFSSSISNRAMGLIKEFIVSFLENAVTGKNGIDIAIGHFWAYALFNQTFTAKTNNPKTLVQLTQSVKDITCENSKGGLDASCSLSHVGTCISCAIRTAADELVRRGRKDAGKVLILLTDACHNLYWEPRINRGEEKINSNNDVSDSHCVFSSNASVFNKGPSQYSSIDFGCYWDLYESIKYFNEHVQNGLVFTAAIVGSEGPAQGTPTGPLCYDYMKIMSTPKNSKVLLNGADFTKVTLDQVVAKEIFETSCNQAAAPVAPPDAPLVRSVAKVKESTTNNNRYYEYITSLKSKWELNISDIQSLERKNFRFDAPNGIMILEQSMHLPFTDRKYYVNPDVLTGIDVRNGHVIWGPTETVFNYAQGFQSSRFIGAALGHLFYIGRIIPPYYSRNQLFPIRQASYSVYAVNTLTGTISFFKRLPGSIYQDNFEKRSQVCFTEFGSSIYIVQDDTIIILGLAVDNSNSLAGIDLLFRKSGYPVAFDNNIVPQQSSVVDGFEYQDCAILDQDHFGYLAKGSDNVIRFHKVRNDGKLIWEGTPNNRMPAGYTLFSKPSVFPNGTTIIGGNTFFVVIDNTGKGNVITLRQSQTTQRFTTFVINGENAFSYNGFYFAPSNVDGPKGFGTLPTGFGTYIIHEEFQMLVMFKIGSKKSMIFDMNGRVAVAEPRWDKDIDSFFQVLQGNAMNAAVNHNFDVAFFQDAMFTFTRLDNHYPGYAGQLGVGTKIKVRARPISKFDFGIN